MSGLDCKYIVYGDEVGESNTPHLQGFVIFYTTKRFAACKKIHSAAHWESAKGTAQQASQYCKKDGKFFERGELPITSKRKGEMEQEKWHEITALAKQGKLDEIEEIQPKIYVIHYRTLKEIAKDNMMQPDNLDAVCGHWYYGEAGTGKTTAARAHDNLFIKSMDRWWDGYQGQDVVLLDDIDLYHKSLSIFLKYWGDKFSFKAETKGGCRWIRPKKFIVTSQYHYNQIFDDKETLEALDRRYSLKHFTK